MDRADSPAAPAGGPDGPVRVGVLLPTREMAMTGRFAMRPVLDFAREAEELGFDSVWAGDSLTARPRFDPLTVLAAVAAVTDRIELGTAALTAALRHPLLTANTVAALDHVAGPGRLRLALGSGFPMPDSEAEFAAAGVPFRGRSARLDEAAAILREAGRGKAEEHAGRFWQFSGLHRLPPPATPDGPPLWLAGGDTPRVVERVAEHYDGWLPFLPTAEAYGSAWQQITERAAEAGRPAGAITPGLYATVAVDADHARAEAALDAYARAYYGYPLDLVRTVQAYGHGDPDAVAAWLRGYIEAGARHVIVRIGSLDPASGLRELADAVLPRVRAEAAVLPTT